MTPYSKVYDAFLARVQSDEWLGAVWTDEDRKRDWRFLLEAAIPWFKFPRVSLTSRTDSGFSEDLTESEIQILATFMKCEWLNRTVLSWENIRPLYDERDFSQANLLDKLTKLLEKERHTAANLERVYYRSINGKPFDFGVLAQNG